MRFDGLMIGAVMFLVVALMLVAWRFWLGGPVTSALERHAWLRKLLWALVLGPPALGIAWAALTGSPTAIAFIAAPLLARALAEGMVRLGWLDPPLPEADMQSYPMVLSGFWMGGFLGLQWLLERLAR